MIKIRNSLFETNSSSADSYADEYNTRTIVKYRQKVHIPIQWDEKVSDNRVSEILNDKMNDSNFQQEYFKIFGISDENPELLDDDEEDVGFISDIFVCLMTTRIEEENYIDMDNCEHWPFKYEDFPDKSKYIDQLMKLFKKHGFTEIISIINIYGEEFNEDDIEDCLY